MDLKSYVVVVLVVAVVVMLLLYAALETFGVYLHRAIIALHVADLSKAAAASS